MWSSEADDTCTDATLQPGGSCHVDVTFNAPTPGRPPACSRWTATPATRRTSPPCPPGPSLSRSSTSSSGPRPSGTLQVGAQSAERLFVANNTSRICRSISRPRRSPGRRRRVHREGQLRQREPRPTQGCRVFVSFRPTHQGPHTASAELRQRRCVPRHERRSERQRSRRGAAARADAARRGAPLRARQRAATSAARSVVLANVGAVGVHARRALRCLAAVERLLAPGRPAARLAAGAGRDLPRDRPLPAQARRRP